MQETCFIQKTCRQSLQVLRAGTRLTVHRALAGLRAGVKPERSWTHTQNRQDETVCSEGVLPFPLGVRVDKVDKP